MKPLLGMVVAMASEARLLLGAGSWHRIEGHWVRRACLPDGTDLMAVRAGIGVERASAAASWLISEGVSALMGMGLSGGLYPGLKAGQLVVAKSVLAMDCGKNRTCWTADAAAVDHARAAFASEGVPVACGTVLTTAEGILTVSRKASLFNQTRALAVDMESAAIARAAQETHLPFFILRAVCDPADEAVPRALFDCLDGSGKIRPAAVLRHLARRPSLAFEMHRMGRRYAAAGKALKAGWRVQMRSRLYHPLISSCRRG